MKWFMIVGLLLLRAAAEAQEPATLKASGTRRGIEITLERIGEREFTLTISEATMKNPELHSTKRLGKKGSFPYRYVRRRKLDERGEDAVLLEFEQIGRSSYGLIIWTKIRRVSADTLQSMNIDREPFCIVQKVSPVGIFPIPLNRDGAPASERFRAAGPTPFRDTKRGKVGYRDPSDNSIQIEPRFDIGGSFVHGLAMVSVGGKTGYIDESGRYIVEPQFALSSDFGQHGDPERARVSLAGKNGMIDKTGKLVIPAKYDRFDQRFDDGMICMVQGGLFGVIDRNGKIVLPAKYQRILPFSEGLAAVKENDLWGFVDRASKYALTPRFEHASSFNEKLAAVKFVNGKWGYINREGKRVLAAIHDKARPFSEGLAGVAKEYTRQGEHRPRLKWGFIDVKGKLVVPHKFDDIGNFVDGFARAWLGDRGGELSKDGTFTPDPQ